MGNSATSEEEIGAARRKLSLAAPHVEEISSEVIVTYSTSVTKRRLQNATTSPCVALTVNFATKAVVCVRADGCEISLGTLNAPGNFVYTESLFQMITVVVALGGSTGSTPTT